MFIDYAEITCIGGTGGSGCMAFHREKYTPQGGPSGGDGGHGGSIIFEADSNLHTLMDFRYQRLYKGNRGEHGKGSNMHGKKARDITVKVPVGTIVRDKQSGEVIADFIRNGQTEVIARGGRGGRGNARFATPTNRTPRKWEYGREGDEIDAIIEVKLFADVGLVGLPNAGKSTLLSTLSAAQPKVADYPFTTLEPQLGIVKVHDHDSFVMADIPGIIEGAHEGKGLGHQFLKHIERTKTLLYMIDGNDLDTIETYKTLHRELSEFSRNLLEKPAMLAITKADTYEREDINIPDVDIPVFLISSFSRSGLADLKEALWERVKQAREAYDLDTEPEPNRDFDF